MHYHRLFLNITCLIIALSFIAGCSSKNDTPVRTQLNIYAAFPKDGSTASGQPIKSFKTEGELSAYIRINGEQFYKMTIEDDRAIFIIKNYQPDAYSINIEFRYQTQEYGSLTLVEATQSVTISEGGTSLTFNEAIYQYLDDDNDKASNYNELRLGTNPRDEDKIAPETIAFPAGGDSGGYWGQQSVLLDCTDLGASGCDKTYYTTDRSDPQTSPTRTEYNGSILITKTTTLIFYSVDKAGNIETIKEAEYIIRNENNPPVTTLSKPAGTYPGLITVTKNCTDSGGSGCGDMYYTMDGSDPKTITPSRIEYSTRITIADTTILKFYSVDKAGNEEETQTFEYKITIAAALNRSIQPPIAPYVAAEIYSAKIGSTMSTFSVVHPSGNFAYRIKDNKISGFQLKPASSKPIFELKNKNTPMNIAVHPSGRFAYIAFNNKISNWITVYTIDQKTGVWNKIAKPVYDLPVHAEIITVTPNGDFLYILSDHNIITYNINPETGGVTESSNQLITLTTTPNAALISQSGEQLYIRYQMLDMVEKYTINIQTGALDGPIKQLPLNSTTKKTMLVIDKSFYLIDSPYPLFTKPVDNYVETFW